MTTTWWFPSGSYCNNYFASRVKPFSVVSLDPCADPDMVAIHAKSKPSGMCSGWWWRFTNARSSTTVVVAVTMLLLLVLWSNRNDVPFDIRDNQGIRRAPAVLSSDAKSMRGQSLVAGTVTVTLEPMDVVLPSPPTCPYQSLKDLKLEERYPRATSRRHMVNPPRDTKLTLVCCQTTQGPWSIVAHHAWAPQGAQRFVDMVQSGYFSTRANITTTSQTRGSVPLMRCVEDYLCQFGLAGDQSVQYKDKIPDDPPWLPTGKHDRHNDMGVRRFMEGYLSYAGSGPNSRGRQLFVSLVDQSSLGQSPWEVPWGELVGDHSYITLHRISTEYGDDGPSQDSLMTNVGVEEVNREFPHLDWIVSCHVVDEQVVNDPAPMDTQ